MAATSSTAIVPQILDVKRDYKDWRVRVKTYLLSKDLWDVVETTSEPPEQEGVSDFKGKKNSEALHAIQLSCGPRTFPLIRDKTRAKAAWDTLEALFNREKSNLLSMAAEYDQEEKPDEILRRDYQPFFAAVRRGNWLETKKFLDEHDHAQTVTDSLGTALHNAVIFGQVKIVEELVKLMTKEELKIQSSDGWTALAYAAREDLKMVTCMVTKSTELLRIPENGRQMTPILIAAMYERWDIVRYLFHQPDFPLKDLMPFKGPYGSQLLVFCLFSKQFDFARELLQTCPRLAYTRGQRTYSPLSAIASVPSAFRSGMSLKFWQWWIYNCIRIDGQDNQRNSTVFGLLQGLPSRLSEFLGINHIRQLKLTHVQSQEILDFMCDVIKHLNHEEMRDGLVYEAVYSAVQNGIVEVVTSICKARPELLFRGLEAGKSIFHYSVECRQEKVYELIYGVGKRNLIMTLRDDSFNGMLHYAGILSPSLKEKLDRIPGAALQMQKERQWYKEVESIVLQLSEASTLNDDGMTPPELFTSDHKELHERGEKWMKDTATSYTVVNALIITIMFAATFTVPGGTDQDAGFPIFLNKKLFIVFIVSDAISFFSSSTSALMFLGILTSRYTEDDFLKSLPTKMIVGLSTLLISIATMMVAFSSTLFIMLHDKPWITYPIIFVASVPVILFIQMQFPFLVAIFTSTYGRGICDKKVKRWI